MKRMFAVVGALLGLVACSGPTEPQQVDEATKVAAVKALLDAASSGALGGKSLN